MQGSLKNLVKGILNLTGFLFIQVGNTGLARQKQGSGDNLNNTSRRRVTFGNTSSGAECSSLFTDKLPCRDAKLEYNLLLHAASGVVLTAWNGVFSGSFPYYILFL